ncbi:MAG: hypothetical protein MK233_07440, partial [Candidatus Poseidoniales archaeon]|nr:hypothetical protein [Candidatus Poseidoniales archaeon]
IRTKVNDIISKYIDNFKDDRYKIDWKEGGLEKTFPVLKWLWPVEAARDKEPDVVIMEIWKHFLEVKKSDLITELLELNYPDTTL